MYLFMFSVLYVISCINMYCNVYLGYSRIIILFYDYLFLGFFFIMFFFFKQKPAYEVLIIDWSSYVCSSDLDPRQLDPRVRYRYAGFPAQGGDSPDADAAADDGRRWRPSPGRPVRSFSRGGVR